MCELHRSHSPAVHSCDRHHVVPVSWGGGEENNIAVICPTGHRSVHLLLRLLMLHGSLPWETARHFGYMERRMAQLGYDRYVASFGAPDSRGRTVLAERARFSGGAVEVEDASGK